MPLTKAGRERIAEAQRRRWKAYRKEHGLKQPKAVAKKSKATVRKRTK